MDILKIYRKFILFEYRKKKGVVSWKNWDSLIFNFIFSFSFFLLQRQMQLFLFKRPGKLVGRTFGNDAIVNFITKRIERWIEN